MMVNNVFDAYLNMHAQTKLTNYSPETWDSQELQLRRLMRSSGGAWYWESYQNAYPKTFQDEIERIQKKVSRIKTVESEA